MDLILGAFFDAQGSDLTADELDLYETMLSENDHDLYAWIARRADTPSQFGTLIDRIRTSRSVA